MILVACGLKREAAWLAHDQLRVIAGGGDPRRLEAELEALAGEADAILSMGLAGGLAPLLAPGDWIVGTVAPSGADRREWSVGAGTGRTERVRIAGEANSNAQVSERNRAWINRLARVLPGAVVGRIHADGLVVATAARKHDLHAATRAIACDMESHVAAAVAARHDKPFAVARVILDPASRSLPRAALVSMRPDGGLAVGAMIGAILTRPWQIPALVRLALDTRRARRAIREGMAALAATGFALTER